MSSQLLKEEKETEAEGGKVRAEKAGRRSLGIPWWKMGRKHLGAGREGLV